MLLYIPILIKRFLKFARFIQSFVFNISGFFLALMLLNIHTSPKLRTIYDVDFGIFGDAAQNTSMLQFFKTLILIHGIITQLLHNKIYL